MTTTAVTLTGTVNPGGQATTYSFEYGTSSKLANATPTASAGSGTANVSVSEVVSGLKVDTSYVFRLVATSSLGTANGVVEAFTTAQSSCASDRTTITTDEQTVSHQKLTVSQQQQSIAATEAGNAVNSATVSQDQATVSQDQETVNQDNQSLSATTLIAPVDGTVTAVNGTVGETVSGSSSASSSNGTGSSGSGGSGSGSGAGAASSSSSSSASSSSSSGFITIENVDKLDVVAAFPEADISNVKVGDTATISFPALTSTNVQGTVTSVSPTSTVSSNVVTYDVTVSLTDPASSVRLGMTANVDVITASATNVMVVPNSAVTTTGNTSTVTLLAGGKQVTKQVVLGLVGSSETEIVSGLAVGDVVVESTASAAAGASTGASTPGAGGGALFRGGGGGAFLGGGGGLGG